MDEKVYKVTVRLLDKNEKEFHSRGGFYVSPDGILSIFSPTSDETRFVVAQGFWQWVECRPLEEDGEWKFLQQVRSEALRNAMGESQ